ncbi:MAG TPA: ABC transporter permease, partial [Aggregatilineales bacterium]|nr:ABC transporter permease [Aggregatilineales bacterium]
MVASDDASPVRLYAQEVVERRTPLMDSIFLFRQNRLAVIAFFIIALFFFIAITATLWTRLGIIDQRSGFQIFHQINPAGLPHVDSFADPMTCAREGLQTAEPWCTLLSEEDQLRYPDLCAGATVAPPEHQWCFVLGSDSTGKDWLTQTVYGAQISLAVAVTGTSVSLVIGLVYGLISGYYGGSIDNVMMRFVDFLLGLPGLVIIILMSVFFREVQREYQDATGLLGFIVDLNASMGGLLFLFIAIGFLSWVGMARLTRGQILAYRQQEFVEAARAIGARDRRIIFVHLLPNIIGPLLVIETLAIPGYIFAEAFLSFIGLGVQPGTPSWGAMISSVRTIGGFNANQHIWLVPGLALVILTLAFNFFGDGLRDAFDPRLRGTTGGKR